MFVCFPKYTSVSCTPAWMLRRSVVKPCEQLHGSRISLQQAGLWCCCFSALGSLPVLACPCHSEVGVMEAVSGGSQGQEVSALCAGLCDSLFLAPEGGGERCPSARLPPVRPCYSTLVLFPPLPLPCSSCSPDRSSRPIQAFGFPLPSFVFALCIV